MSGRAAGRSRSLPVPERLRRLTGRLREEYPGLFASPVGKAVRTVHLSACMIFLFCLLLCLTQLFGLYVYLPAVGELYSSDFMFLSLFLLSASSLIVNCRKTRRIRLSARYTLPHAALAALILLEIPVTYLIVRQPLLLIAKEGAGYLIPPLCFLALTQYPEIRRKDFLPRFFGLIVLFSIASSVVALTAFLLYTYAGVNLLLIDVRSELIRYGTLRLRVGGIVLYTGLILSFGRLLQRRATAADLLNLALGVVNVVVVNKTRTILLYLGVAFLLTLMTEKRTRWIVKLLIWTLTVLLLLAAFVFADDLNPAVYAYLTNDPGIMIRFRAIGHYLRQFLAYPVTGIGLISSSRSVIGWQLLYGPAGKYYRSDVGAVGLINEFGLLGLMWTAWFLISSFRRAGRNGSPDARLIRSLLIYLTVSMINLSFMDPGRCMYIFLVCAFLETLPRADEGGLKP